jgi:hypothetical protein
MAMEHEWIHLVREKVRAEEHKAIDWNKEKVWRRLEKTERAVPSLFRYAVAAGLIMGGVIFYSSHPVFEIPSQVSINTAKTESETPVRITEIQIANDCEAPVQPKRTNKTANKRTSALELAVVPIDSLKTQIFTEDKTIAAADTIIHTRPERQERRIVQAVIGVIPEQANDQIGVLAKTGGIQFEFSILKPENIKPAAEGDAKTISARIK